MPSTPTARVLVSPPPSLSRRHFAVAASPPVEQVVRTDTEPLTKEDIVAYLASGCKPRHNWRIGTEHEKFGFRVDTLQPINYGQIRDLLNGMAEVFGWHRVFEGNNIIGLKKGLQNISIEPGGQVELSGAPLETIHQTWDEVNSHLYQVKVVGEKMGIGFLGIGFQPKWDLSDMPMMPKARFEIMRNFLPKVGSFGLDVMFRSCSANLDFSSERDMIMKFRAGLALQPIATAIFANSPFKEGKLTGFHSFRSHLYTDFDDDRSGMLPFVFDKTFGFEQYVDYTLDVPMCIVYRNKKYIDCTGMSFRVGLLYDDESLSSVIDMITDWTNEEREMLRRQVPLSGLYTPFRGGYVRDLAKLVVKLAKEGLKRRGYEEVGFLNEVDEAIRTGVTPAERLANLYKTKWQHNVDPIFHEFAY
ncbi:hypothetical protein PR202_gb26914 [Eleusine coracana subsp. coracana]|uniref:Glutamate--cysteine ligase n=1 Tax=Eleusine coracana subsp. coracana TaxID=191504 RepID=A0AAV5FQD2_ELECO|nr:hypothetical protein PR202_gb26914 [Eleusine coracana subsp. coracana]